jgi:AcrR family transcriptional regulator
MPKQVDHAQRREELAAALWRLVVREGIEAASIRRVAAEAGWSTGSLRHYFETHSQLLAFAMELVVERVTERLAHPPPPANVRDAVEWALHQVLPLDPERRAEMQVWLAFTMRSLVDPELGDLRERAHAGLRDLCRSAVAALRLEPAEPEAERLHALIDGLALHAVVDPEVTTPARQRELLASYLDARVRPGSG